jgi:hypothetical protein
LGVTARSDRPERPKLADYLGVPEVACGRISGAVEGDRADDAGLALKCVVSLHDRGSRVEAFDGLAGGDAVIGRHEGQATW